MTQDREAGTHTHTHTQVINVKLLGTLGSEMQNARDCSHNCDLKLFPLMLPSAFLSCHPGYVRKILNLLQQPSLLGLLPHSMS